MSRSLHAACTRRSELTDTKDRKEADRAARVASGSLKNASTQELRADMYANADDTTRASLMAAAGQGQLKREADGLPSHSVR